MDIQLKRGLLDVCVLAAITNEDSHGYKIIKDLKPYIELSESTLYTILKRLETANMLTVRTVEHDGRLRKYYHITDAGLKRIDDFKNEWNEMKSCRYIVLAKKTGQHFAVPSLLMPKAFIHKGFRHSLMTMFVMLASALINAKEDCCNTHNRDARHDKYGCTNTAGRG